MPLALVLESLSLSNASLAALTFFSCSASCSFKTSALLDNFSSSGINKAKTFAKPFIATVSAFTIPLPIVDFSKNKTMFSPNVSNAPAKPPAAPSPAPPTWSFNAFKISSCALACWPVKDKTLICSFWLSVNETPTLLKDAKPTSGSSNALPNCVAAVVILPKPTAARSWDNFKTSPNVSPLIDLKVSNIPAASLAPCTLAKVFLPIDIASSSISPAVWPAAKPVAFKSAFNFKVCDSAFAPAWMNFVIPTPKAVNAASPINNLPLTLPVIAPIAFNLPATGPSGPCTAAIEPDTFLNLSWNVCWPFATSLVVFLKPFSFDFAPSTFFLKSFALAISCTCIVVKFVAISLETSSSFLAFHLLS